MCRSRILLRLRSLSKNLLRLRPLAQERGRTVVPWLENYTQEQMEASCPPRDFDFPIVVGW